MSNGTLLVLGGRSDIGLATARAFAAAGWDVQLAARDAATLEPEARDIALRHGVTATCHEMDATDLDSHAAFYDALSPFPQVVVCAVGALGDQARDEADVASATAVMRANFEGPASLLAHAANRMEGSGTSTIVGISSVAGDRGRASNYIYGSAKAGFTAYLSGLRNRMTGKGVHVVTVKPGFVATRMTEGMDLPPALTATPEALGQAIFTAVAKQRDVVYVKPIWRLVMAVIRAIPEALFKKMSI
ncbi:SDR family oxidoreductase [Pseudooceanicola nanhaiensis]|uniref:SDR family oxidoreductase n=1 Tax=Pseudooceanicola nanhaiensis TaxID=375761 RepID=UPI001CD2F9E4|nr:SDR family oxidoreductase [Pseudooceanicola nanhaiensis]MCA0919098.1 SDR family oxidoreductase [Pseudooceanicola nanhaiensis]